MPDRNRQFASSLAASFADLGVSHVCISPGSRNTPLIAGFAAEGRIKKWTLLDERSAGFFAIGLARATGLPVALACTSGTAAAEYHPAVIEASHSEVPLLVLTADRPEELRNVGAPQTIDQVGLYGSSVKLFVDAPTPDDAAALSPAELAVEAWVAATSDTAGPVHLNLPFREPLLDSSPANPSPSVSEPRLSQSGPVQLGKIAAQLNGRRGIIVAGRSNDREFPRACSELAAATRWPIFADPLSGLRHGTHSLDRVVAFADPLVAAGTLDRLHPEVILRFGPVPTSKPIWSWMQRHPEIDQILVDPATRDATNSATITIAVPVTAAAVALTIAVTEPAPLGWAENWAEFDATAEQAVTATLQTADFPNEPAVARTILTTAANDACVTIGSSMPIRDIDTFGGKSRAPLRLMGNRGTNGIDGIVSAALGTAASGAPAVTVLGDVSMFHDINSLGTAAQLGLPLTIVVINNNGGGIFHFLLQHDPDVLEPEVFDRYLATPHGTDFVAIATAFGIEAHEVTKHSELTRLLSAPITKPRLIQVRTDREQNAALHRMVANGVKDAIG
ncbi:MAG: 2-succinyl-5-enolpyruvyl-6-hydroxy-3-cyclohexene-1-carboxylic-acid synthase [Acidimicrobiia bacterium]|nr:2-succinyl-5-enolpyruvyl-6-hydroxy-3-cyclohexene-1-carboxylic-acid synthase [Acidimicrobiia bacterium]MDX2468232.1 2-succinyl-5-enolpyruvyl-6-hydroxy-3-cyclohexene-1-carboxylic-acid synthase [Acidimicrobiia bacterium]